MPSYTIPVIPQVLTPKHWMSSKDISDEVRVKSKCKNALDDLSKAYARANFNQLPPFFKLSPSWTQFNHAKWIKQCDDLVREVIVGGVISLRESTGEVRNAVAATEKLINKKDELAPKSIALLRKMSQAADSLLKELRPEMIEAAIREKEQSVNASMFAIAGKPLDEIKVFMAKAKTAAGLVAKNATPEIFNKVIGSASGGLVRELATILATLAALPATKAIDYDGASAAARIAKSLASMKSLPANATQADVGSALKEFLQNVSDAAKLPKLKISG